MRLIRNGAFVRDNFETAADDAPLPANGTIVSLERFQKDRDTLLARNAPLGVRLKSEQSPQALGEDVHRISVVVLEFPKFRDGRVFSWARQLRARLKYTGEIRAAGDFLYDQIALLARVGVDAFEVPDDFTLVQFHRALGEVNHVYQPSADARVPISELRIPSR